MQKAQDSPRSRPGVYLLAFVVIVGYALALTAYISARRMFWTDEILGWYIISDPSWHHAMESWNTAMDSGGQFYDLIAWCLTRITAYHPHFLRYVGSLYIVSAAALWCSVLRRFYRFWPPVLAVLLTWFCSTEVMFHFAEVRFYSLYLLTATLCVFTAVQVEQRRVPPLVATLLSVFSGTLLIGTHLLGFGWVVLILAAQLSLRRWTPGKIASMIGFCASALVLIPARALFKLAAHPDGWWIQRPTFSGLLRYYLHLVSFGGSKAALSSVMIVVGIVIVAGTVRLVRSRRSIPPAEQLLLTIVILFTLMPIAFYVLSLVRTPMFAARYLEPVYLCVSGLFAFACRELWPSLSPWRLSLRARGAVFAAILVMVVCHALAIRSLVSTYESFHDLDAFATMPGTQPILFQDAVQVENLHIYRPTLGRRYVFFIPRGKTAQSRGWEPVKQGYMPFAVAQDSFLASNPEFLYIPNYWSRELPLDKELLQSDHFSASPVAAIDLFNFKTHETVYLVKRR